MDLELIRLFTQIVDTGTLSAAAKSVYLSQSAATRALQRLEQEYDCQLFERVGRTLRLTAAGRALLPEARALQTMWDSSQASVRKTAVRGYHDLRIGTVDSIGTYLMPKVLARVSTAFDGLGIKFQTGRTSSLLSRLDEDLDVVVIAFSGSPTENSRFVGPYDLQFYGLRSRFPRLAEVDSEDELAAFPIVQIEATAGQPTLIDRDAHSFATAQSLACVKALILGGVGVGALLDYMVSKSEASEVVRAKIPHDPDCGIWVCPSTNFLGGAAEGIVEHLVEELRLELQD